MSDVKDNLEQALDNPVNFAKYFLKLDLFDYQKKILLDCLDYKRIVAIMARQTGKTTVIATFCLYWAFLMPEQSIIIISATRRQAQKLYDTIRNLLGKSPYLSSKALEVFKTKSKFDNGSVIKTLPCGPTGHTIKGETADILILEESAYIKDSIVHEAAMPMIASTQGKVIQLSTPIGRNHFFDASKPNSNYVVHHCTWKDCPLQNNEEGRKYIEEQRRDLTNDQFKREHLAEFTETEDTAIPWALLNECINRDIYLPISYEDLYFEGDEISIGFDIGRFSSSSVISVLGRRGDHFYLIYFREMQNMRFESQYTWFMNIINHFKPSKIFVDATGIGSAMVERLQGEGIPNLRGIVFTDKSKHEMFLNFRKLIEDKRIHFPNNKRMENQFCEQKKRASVGHGKIGIDLYSCPRSSHDDILWATVLAAYTLRTQEMISYSVAI